MFVKIGDIVEQARLLTNNAMTFFGHGKVKYNAQLCLMNLAVYGRTGVIYSGGEGNIFYLDAHNQEGECDYVMANPPFNVDKVKPESDQSAGRQRFYPPSVKKQRGGQRQLSVDFLLLCLSERAQPGTLCYGLFREQMA